MRQILLTMLFFAFAGCGPYWNWKNEAPPAPKDETESFWKEVDGLYENKSGAQIEFNRETKAFRFLGPSTSFRPFLLNPVKHEKLSKKGKPVCSHIVHGKVVKYSQVKSWFDQPTKEYYLVFDIEKKETEYYATEIEKADELENSPLGLAKFGCEGFQYSILPFGNALILQSFSSDEIVFKDAPEKPAEADSTPESLKENLIFRKVKSD